MHVTTFVVERSTPSMPLLRLPTPCSPEKSLGAIEPVRRTTVVRQEPGVIAARRSRRLQASTASAQPLTGLRAGGAAPGEDVGQVDNEHSSSSSPWRSSSSEPPPESDVHVSRLAGNARVLVETYGTQTSPKILFAELLGRPEAVTRLGASDASTPDASSRKAF